MEKTFYEKEAPVWNVLYKVPIAMQKSWCWAIHLSSPFLGVAHSELSWEQINLRIRKILHQTIIWAFKRNNTRFFYFCRRKTLILTHLKCCILKFWEFIFKFNWFNGPLLAEIYNVQKGFTVFFKKPLHYEFEEKS